jgi:hypothetical protein
VNQPPVCGQPETQTTIPEAVKELLEVVRRLQEAYPAKRFTLDGRLVGDIGEILVKESYDVELSSGIHKHHDGITPDRRQVQIKATMKKSLTFPADHVPEYYLGIVIHPDGGFDEVFNGRGRTAQLAVRGRTRPKTNLHSVSISALAKLNAGVREKDRIPLRPGVSVTRVVVTDWA